MYVPDYERKASLADERAKAEYMGVPSGYPGGKRTDIKPVVWPKSTSSRSRSARRRAELKPKSVFGPPLDIDSIFAAYDEVLKNGFVPNQIMVKTAECPTLFGKTAEELVRDNPEQFRLVPIPEDAL